jgi:excinuclease ABC subunit C
MLKQNTAQLPTKPGVYRFLDKHKKIIYVGKAKNLKKRVSQYFKKNITDRKTIALMQNAVDFEITITESENQALLLESNLIKEFHPKYNILLRDDKSYPYLFLSTQHEFPRLDFHRGAKKEKGRYFGPYPNAGSVRDNLSLIQKLFKLRQCSDVFFSHRTRPCLQYQINRCTAPCVKYVSPASYQEQVADTIQFLEGKNEVVMKNVEARMSLASEKMEYETAAHWRNLLMRLRQLQQQQFVTDGKGDIDIFGVVQQTGKIAIAVVSIRNGQLIGHKTYFPETVESVSIEESLSAFVPQYYFNPMRESQPIDRIVLSHVIADRSWIQSALQEMWGSKVIVSDRKTVALREWIAIAVTNAESELSQQIEKKNNVFSQLTYLQKALHLPSLPERIECFDISHTQGEATKASCVVFGTDGPLRKAYRQFNIDNVTPGDDYDAMRQALTRRYTKLKTDNLPLPDLIIIDGGKGQLNVAVTVMETLQISGVILLGVAKGPTRKAGVEKLLIPGRETDIHLEMDHPARLFIQSIRDEAHRFAITKHRAARGKNRLQSVLDKIAGVGKKRKMDLLKYFGGLQGLKAASVEEITKVNGISRVLAKYIYEVLHK